MPTPAVITQTNARCIDIEVPDEKSSIDAAIDLVGYKCRENKNIQNTDIKYNNYARNIFCFVVFVFFAVAKNVFAGVVAAFVFVVSDSRHLCRRKQQKRKQRRRQQKHFSRPQKIQKLQNKKCFEPNTPYFYFCFPDIVYNFCNVCIQSVTYPLR